MPNMKNAIKRVKQNASRKIENNEFKASMRSSMKNVEKAIVSKNKEQASGELKKAITKIDKAKSKGVITDNFVARNKSRLTKKVNAM